MDTLRWILLIIGGIFLFAIYWFGKKSEQKQLAAMEESESFDDDLPVLTVTPDESFDPYKAADELRGSLDDELESLEELLREEAAEKAIARSDELDLQEENVAPQPDKVIVVSIVARPPDVFTRERLLTVLTELGLEYGAMQIFHQHVEDGRREQILFSVANLVKPGTLDMEGDPNFSCPGLSIFMQLPGPLNGLLAFDTMMNCANDLAKRLDGRLLDSSRSTLTPQTVDSLRDEIKDYKLRKYKSGQRQLV